MKILIVNGPNLGRLGEREPAVYGRKTLDDILEGCRAAARELGVDLECFQSNHEGALIDFLESRSGERDGVDGVVINPGALTHYGLSLRDALAGLRCPVIEVHLTNIYAREPFRAHSVVAPVVTGQVAGLGGDGYEWALRALVRSHTRRSAGAEPQG